MNQQVLWGDAPLCWQEVVQVARGQAQLALSAGAWERIAQGRAIVQHIICLLYTSPSPRDCS